MKKMYMAILLLVVFFSYTIAQEMASKPKDMIMLLEAIEIIKSDGTDLNNSHLSLLSDVFSSAFANDRKYGIKVISSEDIKNARKSNHNFNDVNFDFFIKIKANILKENQKEIAYFTMRIIDAKTGYTVASTRKNYVAMESYQELLNAADTMVEEINTSFGQSSYYLNYQEAYAEYLKTNKE